MPEKHCMQPTVHYHCFAGNTEVKSTAAASGAVQALVQLLQQDQTSRLAYEAAELLTTLTSNNAEQLDVMSQEGTLPGLMDLVRKLLQSSDALSDSAANSNRYDTHLDSLSVSDDLVSRNTAVRSHVSSLQVGFTSELLPAQSLDKSTLSWSMSSIQITPGSPAILTLPNGQCSECAIPKSPSGLAGSDSTGLRPYVDTAHADAASGTTNNRGGHASTSAAAEPLTPVSRTFAKSLSLRKSPGRSLSTSLSNSWVGSLVKRLGSTKSHDPAQDNMAAQPDLFHQAGTTICPSKSLASSPMSSSVQNQFGRSHSIRSDTLTQPNSARFHRKTYQPRHSSQALLREIVTTAAHLVEGNLSRQSILVSLGAVALTLDVLTLASKVGPRGGLVGAGAALVRSLCDGNLPAQQAFGLAGSLGQLLLQLQVHKSLT